jgi:hypothetical protein
VGVARNSACLFPKPSDTAMYRIGESLRQAVEVRTLELGGETVRVTADDSLYRAKWGGRNRTEITADPAPPAATPE